MLKVSGHRLDDKHNVIIRKFAKKWKVKEAEALRRIIELYEVLNSTTQATFGASR